MAFVVGSDANLWQLFWHNSSWSWNNLNRPAGATLVKFVGAASEVNTKNPFVYFEGSDNNVWQSAYSGSAFGWVNAGSTPFSSSQGRPAGAAMYGHTAYVFDPSTSYLYSYGWATTSVLPPTSPALSFPVGAISSAQPNGGGNLNMGNYVAAVFSDGNLWVSRTFDAINGNTWINNGHP